MGDKLKRRLCEKEQNFENSSVVEAISIFREYEFGSLTNIDLDVTKLPALAKMKFFVEVLAKIISSRLMDKILNVNETSKKLLEMAKETLKSETVFFKLFGQGVVHKIRSRCLRNHECQ